MILSSSRKKLQTAPPSFLFIITPYTDNESIHFITTKSILNDVNSTVIAKKFFGMRDETVLI